MAESTTKWTRQDFLLTFTATIMKFGDGVEQYLPGVITQDVSCELRVSPTQEGFLAIILLLSYIISLIISAHAARLFGERIIILLSLYLVIAFSIVCAVVVDYYTLLISRALIGLCVGLHGSIIGVYLAKNVSSKDVLHQSSFLFEGMAISLGGGWVSFFGWLLLDHIGWRVFLLLITIPLFILLITILHCCDIKTQEGTGIESTVQNGLTDDQITRQRESEDLIGTRSEKKSSFLVRLIKSSLFMFCNLFVGHEVIILLPWLMRSYKIKEKGGSGHDQCSNYIVHGNDLLILSAITGAANIIGRPIGYFLWKRIKFLPLQITLSVIMGISFALIAIIDNLIVAQILLAVTQLCFAMQHVEIAILLFDYGYFEMSKLRLGSTVTYVAGMFGSLLGLTSAAFLPSQAALYPPLVIILVEIVVICLMTERF